MHEDALLENKEAMKDWERLLRTHLFTDQQYGLVTRLLFSYPNYAKTSVVLCQAFPILEGAAVVSSETTSPEEKRPSIDENGNIQVFFSTVFDTRHHGQVDLLGIGVILSDEHSNSCQLQIGILAEQSAHTNEKIRLEETGLTLSMTNKGKDPSEIFLFMVTMMIPFKGCRHCLRKSDGHTSTAPPQSTHARMLKCGRCWERLRFPVWYCNTDCQPAHYQRHHTQDGCGYVKSDQ